MNVIRNLSRSTASFSLLQQQLCKSNRLTPISCYHHHFYRNEDETLRRRTGFALGNLSGISLNNLHKSIHSSSALHFKYSNLLANKNKVTEDVKTQTDSSDKIKNDIDALEEVKKLGLFARFKKMAKDYWYVLIPVHVVTSCFWLGGFYYASKR